MLPEVPLRDRRERPSSSTRTPTTGSRRTISKWPFSFENVCGILKLDPDYLRRGLFRWCERQDELRRRGKVVPLKSRKPAVSEPVPVGGDRQGAVDARCPGQTRAA